MRFDGTHRGGCQEVSEESTLLARRGERPGSSCVLTGARERRAVEVRGLAQGGAGPPRREGEQVAGRTFLRRSGPLAGS